jgi:threonine dehydratase
VASSSIGRSDISDAAERIAGFVRLTPMLELGRVAGAIDVALKLESLQVTGSFKARGAFSRMRAAAVGEAGVLAASGGNFGIAVAYAARILGHRAEIFVPSTSPEAKIQRIRDEAAHVTVVPGYYADAAEACRERARAAGALMMHPYDQAEVVAGQGTIGIELDAQAPDADTVLVAVGGAGLIGGIAAWFAGRRRVVGVETESCPTLHAALAAGGPIDVEVGGVAADSLGARRVGEIGFGIAGRFVDQVILVSDAAVVEAQRWLWRTCKILAEPGGATSLAALLSGAYVPEPGERVAVVICGANADPSTIVSDGRSQESL